MDAPPMAAYPFGAHCVRPKRTSSRFVNLLRSFDSHRLHKWKRGCPEGQPHFHVGGGGENRTRVRKSSAPRSTCLFRL